MVCQLVLLTLHYVYTNVQRCYRLHLGACIKCAIESLLHFNEI